MPHQAHELLMATNVLFTTVLVLGVQLGSGVCMGPVNRLAGVPTAAEQQLNHVLAELAKVRCSQ